MARSVHGCVVWYVGGVCRRTRSGHRVGARLLLMDRFVHGVGLKRGQADEDDVEVP